MNILLLQGIFTVTIFLLTLLCILLPLRIYPRDRTVHVNRKSQRIMAFCNCVSGGVFLGVCFMGLMPFCRQKFESSFDMVGMRVDYPLSELGVVLGFFLILLVEQSMLVCQNRKRVYEENKEMLEAPGEYLIYTSESDITGDSDSEFEVPPLALPTVPISTAAGAETEVETAAMLVPHPEQLSEQVATENTGQNGGTLPVVSSRPKHPRRKRRKKPLSRCGRGQAAREQHLARHGHGHSHGSDHGGGHGHSHMLEALNQNSGLRCFILMIALGIHAIFEGMALGLQDQLPKLVNLYIGVLVHECLVSFAMGISLARQKLRLGTVVKLSILLCSMIPIGIGIGLAIGVVHTFAGSLTSAILQAIAAGTFLYVIFLEILPAEVNEPHDRLLKVFFLFFGFGLVACLQVATGGH